MIEKTRDIVLGPGSISLARPRPDISNVSSYLKKLQESAIDAITVIDIPLDFENEDLSWSSLWGIGFFKQKIIGANFSNSDFGSSDRNLASGFSDSLIEKSDFSMADFYNCQFRQVKVEGTDMSGALIRDVTLNNTSFKSTDLGHSNFSKTYMFEPRFSSCNLSQAVFDGSHIWGQDINDSDAPYPVFSPETDLSATSFRDTGIRLVNFSKLNLSEANFSGSDLHYAEFKDSDLDGAIFSETRLFQVSFEQTMRAVDFSRTAAKQIKIKSGALVRADFSRAHVQNSDFSGVNFLASDFTGAVFEQVDFSQANLSEIIGKDSVKFSDCVF